MRSVLGPALISAIVPLAAAWAVRGKSASIVAPSRWRGDTSRRSLALTFDDGPSESTGVILELLAKFGVTATFFQCGANAERLPIAAAAVSRAGHEIGNHTWSHSRLWLRSPAFIDTEIRRAQQTLTRVHGQTPRVFRAPYGVRWPGLAAAQRRHGLQGVMWTVIARDWAIPAPRTSSRLLRAAAPGAILCLHDGRELAIRPNIGETIETVRVLVPRLLNEGYRFETVSSILCPTTSLNA
ncbi:MAG: polysaccharide deacetylase family protein [Bryobacteraceae bacterium]